MLPLVPAKPIRLAGSVLFALLATAAAAQPAEGTFTMRLRDAPVAVLVRALFTLTGQGYVLDSDVVQRIDAELIDVTEAELERALEALGLELSPPERIRRISRAGRGAPLELPGTGFPIAIELSGAQLRDFLMLMEDISGDRGAAPLGPLGSMAAFVSEVPADDVLAAVLASARLRLTRDGGRFQVSHAAEPDAPLWPLGAGARRYGHVASRETVAPATRPSGIHGLLAREARFIGLASGNGTSYAVTSQGGLLQVRARFADGSLDSIAPEGVVISVDGSRGEQERLEWRIAPVAPGLRLRPESLADRIDRARVASDARDFDEAERLLRSAPANFDGPALRAALGDLHYGHAQALLGRHAVADAIRQLERAFEIDRQERPWQAGEDLNEIGFAWTSIGEAERAVAPHRQALELVRTADLRQEPRGAPCVRVHPRSSMIEPSALNGLANAERERGRYAEARALYEKALAAWSGLGDSVGASAALSGLGLVASATGDKRQAVKLQQRAVDTKGLDPQARGAVRNNLARAQLDLARKDDAVASYRAALADYRSVRDRAGEAVVLANLGALFESSGARADACASFAEALEAAREADDRRGVATTRARLEGLVGRSPDDPRLARCRAALVPKP